MKFLPAEDMVFSSRMKEDEIIKRISENLEPPKTIRWGRFTASDTKPYEGQVYKNKFRMNRIIRYRNSFLPQISGYITQNHSGTQIHVKMRLHLLVIIFLFLWGGGLLAGSLAFLSQNFNNQVSGLLYLIPIGVLAVVYLLPTLAFKYESSKTKTFLQQLFDAQIIEE